MATTPERVAPHSNNAEQAVLGAILLDNSSLADVLSILPHARAFYSRANNVIFDTIVTLNQCGLPADTVTVAEELERRGQLKNCGGRAYLTELASGMATASNVAYYARIVAEKYSHRRVIALATDIISSSYRQEETPEEIANKSAIDLYSIIHSGEERRIQPTSEIVPAVMENLDNIASGKVKPGIMTGYFELDEVIAGFQKGELIVIGARPTVGKTAFMSCCAINIVKKDIPVLFISAETGKKELVLRLVCTHGSFNSIALKRGAAKDNWDTLIPAMNDVASWPFYIEDTPRIDISTLVAKISNFHKAGKCAIVFIDHLQKITMKNSRMPRWEQVGYFTATLKAMASDLNIPVVLASQLTPDIDKRRDHRPKLSDFRESHNIEQDADTCIGLYRGELYASKGELKAHTYDNSGEAIVLKQRNGPTGKADLFFNKQFTRFENLESELF